MKPKTKSGVILKNRRKLVLKTLIEQLAHGMKPSKVLTGVLKGTKIPLTPEDIVRINKEITVLNTRI